MLENLIRKGAKAKVLANKEKIREEVRSISPEDLGTVIDAIENERDIIPFIPEDIMAGIIGKPSYVKALANADFLLGLTDEILPEYSELLRAKKSWLERQIGQLVALC